MPVPEPAVDACVEQVDDPRGDAVGTLRRLCLGLSVGKGCIRYRRPEQVDEAVVRSILEMTAATRGPNC